MLTWYVSVLSILLWSVVVGTIVYGVVHASWIVIRNGNEGTDTARKIAASGIINGLTVTMAITLLATTQLGSWNSIGLFVAAAGLRSFVKLVETHILR